MSQGHVKVSREHNHRTPDAHRTQRGRFEEMPPCPRNLTHNLLNRKVVRPRLQNNRSCGPATSCNTARPLQGGISSQDALLLESQREGCSRETMASRKLCIGINSILSVSIPRILSSTCDHRGTTTTLESLSIVVLGLLGPL